LQPFAFEADGAGGGGFAEEMPEGSTIRRRGVVNGSTLVRIWSAKLMGFQRWRPVANRWGGPWERDWLRKTLHRPAVKVLAPQYLVLFGFGAFVGDFRANWSP
jgi:hypothetical protein